MLRVVLFNINDFFFFETWKYGSLKLFFLFRKSAEVEINELFEKLEKKVH